MGCYVKNVKGVLAKCVPHCTKTNTKKIIISLDKKELRTFVLGVKKIKKREKLKKSAGKVFLFPKHFVLSLLFERNGVGSLKQFVLAMQIAKMNPAADVSDPSLSVRIRPGAF